MQYTYRYVQYTYRYVQYTYVVCRTRTLCVVGVRYVQYAYGHVQYTYVMCRRRTVMCRTLSSVNQSLGMLYTRCNPGPSPRNQRNHYTNGSKRVEGGWAGGGVGGGVFTELVSRTLNDTTSRSSVVVSRSGS